AWSSRCHSTIYTIPAVTSTIASRLNRIRRLRWAMVRSRTRSAIAASAVGLVGAAYMDDRFYTARSGGKVRPTQGAAAMLADVTQWDWLFTVAGLAVTLLISVAVACWTV